MSAGRSRGRVGGQVLRRLDSKNCTHPHAYSSLWCRFCREGEPFVKGHNRLLSTTYVTGVRNSDCIIKVSRSCIPKQAVTVTVSAICGCEPIGPISLRRTVCSLNSALRRVFVSGAATLGCRLPLPAAARQQGAWKVWIRVLLPVRDLLALLVVKTRYCRTVVTLLQNACTGRLHESWWKTSLSSSCCKTTRNTSLRGQPWQRLNSTSLSRQHVSRIRRTAGCPRPPTKGC